MTPSKQHEEHAKKILARRAGNKSNDKPAPKEVEAPKAPTIKELRAECKERGIDFKKKDTIAILTEKLKG